jgi:hypothetical protein
MTIKLSRLEYMKKELTTRVYNLLSELNIKTGNTLKGTELSIQLAVDDIRNILNQIRKLK